ncbi:MAG: hypothetical protein J1F32_03630 [Erysipelotrichales bacterium]|nr:hypothetical protein [Erysipelotrichales bacterium]
MRIALCPHIINIFSLAIIDVSTTKLLLNSYLSNLYVVNVVELLNINISYQNNSYQRK